MLQLVLTFVPVCVATAFVCTAVKEEKGRALAEGTIRLAAVLAIGISAFGGAIHLVSSVFR